MRNAERATERSTKSVEMFGRFAGEAIRVGIERVVLQILKQAAMILAGAAFGGEGDVADLGKLRAVVERSYLYG